MDLLKLFKGMKRDEIIIEVLLGAGVVFWGAYVTWAVHTADCIIKVVSR